MSALFYYTEYDGHLWSDQPACVSPLLRQLCIELNDSCCSLAEREELIGPHLFAPMGTAMKDDPKRLTILAAVARKEGFPGPHVIPNCSASRSFFAPRTFAGAFKRKWQKKGKGPEGKRRLLAIILRLCQIGTPQEIVPQCSKEALFERLEK